VQVSLGRLSGLLQQYRLHGGHAHSRFADILNHAPEKIKWGAKKRLRVRNTSLPHVVAVAQFSRHHLTASRTKQDFAKLSWEVGTKEKAAQILGSFLGM
jgi:hypothetical protein